MQDGVIQHPPSGWGSDLSISEPFIAYKYCLLPSSFSISHINHWCRSGFSHLCLYTTKDAGSARCPARSPPELSWQLVRWAVTPIGTMEFGQTCKLSPHQTPSFVYGNLTTVESSIVGQIRLWTACVHLFLSRCIRMMMQIPPSHVARVVQTSVHYWLFVEAKKSRIRPSNFTAHTHTYSCQSLHFTFSIQQRVRHPQRRQTSSKSKQTILKYWAIFWFIPYY